MKVIDFREIDGQEFKVNGKKIKLPCYAQTGVILEDKIITNHGWKAFIQLYPEISKKRCVWCYDYDGNVLWIVEKPYFYGCRWYEEEGKMPRCETFGPEKGKYKELDMCIQSLFYSEEKGKIYVSGLLGSNSHAGWELNPEDGTISNISIEWTP